MTLYNNNLSLNQQDKNVALLHSRLISLGYAIVVSEIHSERFGESTQQTQGLPVTGSVDGATWHEAHHILSVLNKGLRVICEVSK